MKKLLVFALLFLLVGCGFFEPPTTTTTTTVTTTTEDLARIAARQRLYGETLKFGDPEDTDLQFDEYTAKYAFGDADLVLWSRDDSINLVIIDGPKYVLVEIALDYGDNSLSTLVWNIMYTYIDVEREIYIFLDYYYYGRFLIEDFSPITVDIRQKEWAQELQLLTIEDVEFVIGLLGYDVS